MKEERYNGKSDNVHIQCTVWKVVFTVFSIGGFNKKISLRKMCV